MIGCGFGSFLLGVLFGYVGVVVEWMGNSDLGLGIFVEREVFFVLNECLSWYMIGLVMVRLI